MVSNLEVRENCPSISFLFARLGGSLGVFPNLRGFVSEGSSLGVVLGDLYPLLRESVDWFEDLVKKLRLMSEVRSSDLDTGLSSSDGPMEGDTAVSTFREVRAFHALVEPCGLDSDAVNRFRDRFQFPERVRVRRPTDDDRACSFFPGEVCFYEAAFTCGLRLPVHPFVMELLAYLGIAPGQLMPNSWRIVVNCMEIWLAANGDMIKVNELVYLYRLKESKEYGYYELVPWERRTRIVKGLPSSFRYWKSRFVFVSGDNFETPSSQDWGEIPRLLRRWGTPTLAKRRPKLKSRYKERVEAAITYSQSIDNWDDLVDPRTLAFYNLGPDPSSYVLRSLDIEGKKKMTTKFNKGMYEKMRSKKDEPLSSLGKKVVRVKGKVTSVTPTVSTTPVVSGAETTRTASPATSVEEIPTPASKRPRTSDKEKDNSGSSSIWDDERLATDRARGVVNAEDLKVLSGSTPAELMGRHIHKLVQVLGEAVHFSAEYQAQEAKVESSLSRIKVLEMENSRLKRELTTAMEDVHQYKDEVKKLGDDLKVEQQLVLEKDEQLAAAKEKIKVVASRAIEGFQQTEEYNSVLFSWYFKGFELLRRYCIKHPSGVDLEALDMEEVDKEISADEAALAAAAEAPEDVPDAPVINAPALDAPAGDDADPVV
ncbi:uncharacterized protein LOC142641244 [Castanea sativa]|uniref:uncharacterized protein LOC142641244 n=2 Tax=Castanea sativa TaxID=21020 RepID=UPI003F64AA3F